MTSSLPWYKTQSPKWYLFSLVVTQHLGSNASSIINHLMKYNTLTKTQILKLSQVKNKKLIDKSLLVLLQLNCVVYSYDKSKKVYQYSVNDEGIFKLFYSNDIISLVNEFYKGTEIYPEIIQNVLLSGNLSINDYLSKKDDDETINAFNRLVNDNWLVPINELHFQNKFDKFNQIFKDELYRFNAENKGKVISQSKKLLIVKDLTVDKFLSLYQSISTKRDLNQSLTVNFNKFKRYQKCFQLSTEAKNRIGEITSKIYLVALKLMEQKHKHENKPDYKLINSFIVQLINSNTEGFIEPPEDASNITITPGEVLREIERSLPDLKEQLVGTIYDSSESSNKRVKLENGYLASSSSTSLSDLNNIIYKHMKLLTKDLRLPFMMELQPNNHFIIPYQELNKTWKIFAFKQYVRNIFGSPYLRIMNCIEERRLLDEKNLSKISLMKEKDIRMILIRLIQFQILELQEIPKTQDRSAMRSVFAFRIASKDYMKSIDFFNNCVLYNLAQLLNNLNENKTTNKILLDKLNRDDIKGNELKFLLKNELIQLKEYQNVERQNLVKLQRLKLTLNCMYL